MITCEKLTKWRDGKKYVIACSQPGWLSTGVDPPDRSCSTITTRTIRSANCAIDREMVPRNSPSAVAKNKYNTTPVTHRTSDPSNGTLRIIRTTRNSDSVVG